MRNPASTGGSSAAQGVNYEERVGAWAFAQLLSASPVQRWGGLRDWRVKAVWMQAPVAAGDVVLEHSGEGAIYVQAKFRKGSVAVNAQPTGLLAEVLGQFARQFLASTGASTEKSSSPWARPFDTQRDRLALVVPSSAGESLTRRTAHVLDRLREPGAWLNPKERFSKAETERFELIVSVAKEALVTAGAQVPDVQAFLTCVCIVALDVADGEPSANEAIAVLENSVLLTGSPLRATRVWRHLIHLARSANCTGGRLGTIDLARKLLEEGVALRAPYMFRESIKRLQEITQRNLKRLRRNAELRVSATQGIEIPRQCAKDLRDSLSIHRVVIGQPGAGKSGVLYQVCERLLSEGKDVVLLLADDLQAASGSPLRDVLRLDNDLPEVLAGWLGAESAYLVIDALDAARDPKVAHQLRSSMLEVTASGSRWTILASVRRFDLKHSPEIRDLFPGQPTEGYANREFAGTAHFDVPALQDAELRYAGDRNPALANLLAKARRDKVTRELLLQPFNLALACELLRAGVTVQEIVPIETNTALLDLFWNRRVTDSQPRGAEREAVLAVTVKKLVSDLAMRIPDNRDPENRHLVSELADRHVLDPAAFRDGEIRFAHHLLHDYAVSQLLFRQLSAVQLVAALEAQPELFVYARQSLLLHFDQLWNRDPSRQIFWSASVTLMRSPLPLVARILGTECAVMKIVAWTDFAPLLAAVQTADAAASAMLRYTVGSFMDIEDSDQLAAAGPAWAHLAVHLADKAGEFSWQVHLLLNKLVPERLPAVPAVLPHANRAGRLLAAHLFRQPEPVIRFGPPFLTAVRTICRTAAAAPADSIAALLPLIAKEFARHFGDRVYWSLADETKHLIPIAPEFVRDFYITVFGNEVSADGWEQFGSKIMPMQMKRSDNYGLARHRLHADFPGFFRAAPVEATMAVVRFMPAFRQRHHPLHSGKRDIRRRFRFENRSCHLVDDLSYIWASDASHHDDDALAVLREMRAGWVHLARTGRKQELEAIIAVMAKEAELAILWRVLLDAGNRAPASLGVRISPLLAERAILVGVDTHHAAARLLAVVYPYLKRSQRARIERVVLTLPKQRWKGADNKLRSVDGWRGLYLNQMPTRLMATAKARALRRALEEADALRKNVAPFRSYSSTGRMEWADFVPSLRHVDLKTSTHLAAREWDERLRQFARTDGKGISSEAVDAIWPSLSGAYQFAVNSAPTDLHPDLAQIVWAQTVNVAEIIVRSGSFPAAPERRDFLRALLLRAARDPRPETDSGAEASFARGPSWGSPSPRINAAQALIVWPRESGAIDDEIRTVLRTLAADPHPAVRFQIAASCNALYEADQTLMWDLIRERTAQETNAGVWTGWLGVIDRIAPGHRDEAAALFFDFLKRFPQNQEDYRDSAAHAVSGLSDLFVRFGHPGAAQYVMEMVEDPITHAHFLGHLCHSFRNTLAVGFLPNSTEFQRALHQRGLDFFLRLARSAAGALQQFDAAVKGGTPPKTEDVRSVLQLLDNLNMQVFFASGAHDAKKTRGSDEPAAPPVMEFWHETKPIIEVLVGLPSAHIAYHLAETLEHLVPADPRAIFRCIVAVVANTKPDGFAQESLAVGVISRIVERYLADYAALFIEDRDCMAGLIQVLDTFADVGWPEARRLIRNLSRLYR